MTKARPQFRNVFVTSFKCTVDGATMTFDPKRVKFAQWQEERCPETGRLHYHFAIWFVNPVTTPGVQRMIHDATAEVESMKNEEKSEQYTMKEDTRTRGPWTFGDRSTINRQGQRTDLEYAMQLLRDGYSWKQLAEARPATTAQYSKFLRDYASELDVCRPDDVTIRAELWFGPPGTGKTHTAREEFPDSFVWTKQGQFTEYAGQETVILDEVDSHSPELDMKDWLSMLQAGKYVGRGHYVRKSILATTFIITTNQHPREWFKRHSQVTAFRRRITDAREFTVVHPSVLEQQERMAQIFS